MEYTREKEINSLLSDYTVQSQIGVNGVSWFEITLSWLILLTSFFVFFCNHAFLKLEALYYED